MQLGALFDWDGVVIDSSAQHEVSWERLARELGKPLPPDLKAGAVKVRDALDKIMKGAAAGEF